MVFKSNLNPRKYVLTAPSTRRVIIIIDTAFVIAFLWLKLDLKLNRILTLTALMQR